MTQHDASWEDWTARVSRHEKADPLWRMSAYRRARYVMDLAWADVSRLHRWRLGRATSDQLWRALGSIPANLAEGYSRSGGLDRVRFFEYGLGSTRESIVWYRGAEPLLGRETVEARLDQLAQVRSILLTAIPAERRRRIRPSGGE